jgi:hypothetical protein
MAYALFLDILGTSARVCSLPDDYDFGNDDVLGSGYRSAHYSFREAVLLAEKYLPAGSFIALFSDCVYLVQSDPLLFSRAVNSLLYHVRHTYIPFRGGIGYGNFHFEQTSHIASTTLNINESSFFGSSLVFAHRAESCGLKGMRVFVHRSAASALSELYDGLPVFPRHIILSEDDQRPPTFGATTVVIPEATIEDVQHEICYLGNGSVEVEMRWIDMVAAASGVTESTEIHYAETRKFLERLKLKRNSVEISWRQAASQYGF